MNVSLCLSETGIHISLLFALFALFGLELFLDQMGWQKWRQSLGNGFTKVALILTEPFAIFTLALLSLLLPLSFLLLARLTNAQYLLTINPPYPSSTPESFILNLFLLSNPTLLHPLLSFISVTALLHGLTGGTFTILTEPSSRVVKPSRLYMTWIFLCALQVCVGIGMEGMIAANLWPVEYGIDKQNMLLCRIVFFIGLFETMLHWSKNFVKPVVDDTVFGVLRDEQWIERVVLGVGFGGLWWWKLRAEIEGLAVIVEVKREASMGLGMTDILSWWLYYLTVTVGMVRIVRGVLWLGRVLLCVGLEEMPAAYSGGDDDDKV